MEDHRLGDLLRELPREHARPGFTARVLKNLDLPGRAPRRSLRLALAGAMAVALAVSAGLLTDWQAGPREAIRTSQARQALQELRAEHGRLERELRELSQPPMYIGGNEDVDLVLDLGQVRESEGATPAAYRVETF
jgi:type II secretory pathway component PulM